MPANPNPFKKALKNGETIFGCWLGMADTFSAELMGTAGFDWLLVDGEHAPNDLRSTRLILQVLESSDSHAAVRVPIGQTYILKQILDAGAQTVLVPMVETAEHARQLVRDVTFPPHGDRGVGQRQSRNGRVRDARDLAELGERALGGREAVLGTTVQQPAHPAGRQREVLRNVVRTDRRVGREPGCVESRNNFVISISSTAERV